MPTAERYRKEAPIRASKYAEMQAAKIQATQDAVKKNGLPLGEILRLRCVNGLTYPKMAKMYGVATSAIRQALEPYLSRISIAAQAKAYQVREATFLAMLESELALDLLSPAKRQAASLNNVAYAFTQVNHARLLAQGKSTENISTRSVVMQAQQAISAIQAEISRRSIIEHKCVQADAVDNSVKVLHDVDNSVDNLAERIPDIALRLQLAEQAQLCVDITQPLDMTESDNV